MGNSILWRYGSKAGISDLPTFLQAPELYNGKARDTSGSPVHGWNVSTNASTSSGKLTHGFAAALLRAAAVYNGAPYDGWSLNDEYAAGEYSSTIEWTTALPPAENTLVTSVLYTRSSGVFRAEHGGQNVKAGYSSSPLFMALWGLFMENSEFNTFFTGFCDTSLSSDERALHAVRLAEIAYYMTSGSTPAITIVNEQPKLLSMATLQNPRFVSSLNKVGTFRRFLDNGTNSSGNPGKASKYNFQTFAGVFAIPHTAECDKFPAMPDEMKALIPVLDEKDVISNLAVRFSALIQSTTKKARPIRNILLYGSTGSGKTTMAKHIAVGNNLPYATLTCNSDTSIPDLLIQCMPEGGGEKLDIKSPDGIPDVETMNYAPDLAWESITGEENPDATTEDCMKAAYKKMTGEEKDISMSEYVAFIVKAAVNNEESATGQKFVYVESPLVKAARYGGVVEIQEPTTIVQGGVLPGLNALLDADGKMFLPSGELIQRHPNCVVIATTNFGYVGCRRMNQSFLRRFQLKAVVSTPSGAELVKRIKAMVGFSKSDYVTPEDITSMIDCLEQIRKTCEDADANDGDIGICEIADWVNCANCVNSITEAAQYTIVPSATQDTALMTDLTDIIAQKITK